MKKITLVVTLATSMLSVSAAQADWVISGGVVNLSKEAKATVMGATAKATKTETKVGLGVGYRWEDTFKNTDLELGLENGMFGLAANYKMGSDFYGIGAIGYDNSSDSAKGVTAGIGAGYEFVKNVSAEFKYFLPTSEKSGATDLTTQRMQLMVKYHWK